MASVFILFKERDLTPIITEECVTKNGDNDFSREGLGVLKTNKKCVCGHWLV